MDSAIDFSSDFHMHTSYSDGSANVRLVIETAIQKGMQTIAITDHMPLPILNRYAMNPDAIGRYKDEIRRVRADYADRIDVKIGMEMELLPGYESWTENIVKSGWEYTIGSVHGIIPNGRHSMVNGTAAEFNSTLDDEFNGDIRAFCTFYYKSLQAVIDSGLFTTVGHLDVVKKHNKHQAYFDENETWYRDLVIEAIDHVRTSGMQLEINVAGFNHPVGAPYPSPWIVAECIDRGVPLVVSSDAHRPENIGGNFSELRSLPTMNKEIGRIRWTTTN